VNVSVRDEDSDEEFAGKDEVGPEMEDECREFDYGDLVLQSCCVGDRTQGNKRTWDA